MKNHKRSKVENYYTISDDVWENVTFHRPKDNVEFRINVSGMTFEALVAVLRFVADCMEHGIQGKDSVTASGDIPFLDPEIFQNDKWPWEDGYGDMYNHRRLFEAFGVFEEEGQPYTDIHLADILADKRPIIEIMTKWREELKRAGD